MRLGVVWSRWHMVAEWAGLEACALLKRNTLREVFEVMIEKIS
jgi:hypothetical protein